MKKNIREDFKELRKSKGYATRDQLMGSIEKYCKEKQIEKINIKTIQRMENDHKASDKTIEIVSSVLSVPIEELTSNNLKKKEPLEAYSKTKVNKILTLTDDVYIKTTKDAKKRKFIFDTDKNKYNFGQNEAIKQLIKLLDQYYSFKENPLSQMQSDKFGSSTVKIQDKLDIEYCVEQTIKGLISGNKWLHKDRALNSMLGYDSLDNKMREKLKDNAGMEWVPFDKPYPNNEKPYPIYTYFGVHPFATYWPFPLEQFKKLPNLSGKNPGYFTEIFENQKITSGPYGDMDYHPSMKTDFILSAVYNRYIFFVFSSSPNLDLITYDNKVSEIVMEDLEKVMKADSYLKVKNTKLIGKVIHSTFEDIINQIGKNAEYPINYIEDKGFTKIYSQKNINKYNVYNDADVFLGNLQEAQDKVFEKVTKNKDFYRYANECLFASKMTADSLENRNQKTRIAWLKKKKATWVINEDIEHLVLDADTGEVFQTGKIDLVVEKVSKIILEGGKKLTEALNKARPITQEDI